MTHHATVIVELRARSTRVGGRAVGPVRAAFTFEYEGLGTPEAAARAALAAAGIVSPCEGLEFERVEVTRR